MDSRSSWKADWQKIKRLLLIRLDSMGDVLMTTPAFTALKESFPATRLTLLTSPEGAKIALYIPGLAATISMRAPWVKNDGPPDSPESYIAKLKKYQFDAAIIFAVYSQNPLPAAMLVYLANIPLRLAYSHENPYHLLTHWLPDPEPVKGIKHEVERQLDLVKSIGATPSNTHLSLSIPQHASQKVDEFLKANHLQQSSWFIFHPGAREERRQYPINKFIMSMKLVLRYWSGRIIITGTAKEQILAKKAVQALGINAISLAGRINLGELAALIQKAPLIVSNNTGPVHIAAAVNTPVLDVYARTNPQHTPWQVKNVVLAFDVPCRDCERNICVKTTHPPLKIVSPHQIASATLELLGVKKTYVKSTSKTSPLYI